MTPPIPPGCERFICERDGRLEAALVFPLDFAAHPATEPFNAHQRSIVAAYCEVAWLKEAERLEGEMRKNPPDPRLKGLHVLTGAHHYAGKCARAWRKWGEG